MAEAQPRGRHAVAPHPSELPAPVGLPKTCESVLHGRIPRRVEQAGVEGNDLGGLRLAPGRPITQDQHVRGLGSIGDAVSRTQPRMAPCSSRTGSVRTT
jgi:hypothetical protein